MNSVQLHLALTHLPVVLSLTGFILLAVAFFIRNTTLTKTAYSILLAAGIAAIPVFLSGEGAEEAVEHLPGVSESITEQHETIAKLAMIVIVVTAIVAVAALIAISKNIAVRFFQILLLLLALTTCGLMLQTAHLGGQIRHTEIRKNAAIQTNNSSSEMNGESKETKDDDD